MATSAQQATFAAQNGVNWADPTDPNFGKAGYINQNQYNQYQSQYGGAPAPSATGLSGNGVNAPFAAPPATAPGVSTDPTTTSFVSTLTSRMNPAPVTQNDPAISGAIGANNLALQRGEEMARNSLAEQAARTGTDASGGLQTGMTGLAEDMAAKQGQFAGNAVENLQAQRNASADNALGILSGYLTGGAQRAQQSTQFGQSLTEQQREADIDSQLKAQGIDVQKELGLDDIQTRKMLGLLSMYYQNQQFGEQLGQQGSEFAAGLDNSTLMGLLSGIGG